MDNISKRRYDHHTETLVPIHHLPSTKLFRHLLTLVLRLKHIFQLIQDLRNKTLQGGPIWRKSEYSVEITIQIKIDTK